MSSPLEVPAVLWERLREAFPGADDAELATLAHERGRAIARRSEPPPLRQDVAERAAAVIILAQRLAPERRRLAEAEVRERESYEHDLRLQREIVPPLKERARALRARIRELEDRVRAAGRDPAAVAPAIDWPDTLAVDDYRAPRFERDQDRRRAAIEFFRRRG
jgi:hypothetical protein